MKKRLLIALAVVLSLSIAGCGKSEKKPALTNKDLLGIWQCTAALESMDSYSKFYEEAKDIYDETYSSVPNVLTLEENGKASYFVLDYQYYGKWKLKGKSVTFTVEDSKSVVEGANDLLPRLTRRICVSHVNLSLGACSCMNGIISYMLKNVAIEIDCYVFSYNQ